MGTRKHGDGSLASLDLTRNLDSLSKNRFSILAAMESLKRKQENRPHASPNRAVLLSYKYSMR